MANRNDTAKLHDDLKVEEYSWGRIFKGSEAALVAAGLVQSEWLPGKPGGNKVSTVVVFEEDGKGHLLVGGHAGKREHLNIKRAGKNSYCVWKSFSPAEVECRRREEDPGFEAAKKGSIASPARFNVGDVCTYWKPGYEGHGEKLEITTAFEFCCVRDSAGRFIDKDGDRIDYRWGYRAREIGGKSHFYAAYELLDRDHSIRHIRLVSAPQTDMNENRQFAA